MDEQILAIVIAFLIINLILSIQSIIGFILDWIDSYQMSKTHTCVFGVWIPNSLIDKERMNKDGYSEISTAR